MNRDYRDEEKAIFEKLVGLRDSEAVKLVTKLVTIRYEMHKEALVMNSDDVAKGKAQECRALLKGLKINGD